MCFPALNGEAETPGHVGCMRGEWAVALPPRDIGSARLRMAGGKRAQRVIYGSPRRSRGNRCANETSPRSGRKSMPHSFHSLLIHAVFSTKDRVAHMDAELRSNLFPYMGGILREMGCSARLINGTADHVHLLMDLAADLSVAECMRVVKANSSRWIHETWPQRRAFAWQTGYGAFTVSASSEQAVLDYIRAQEEHHRRISFQEEFVASLRKHGVPFDEKFLWDGSVARSTG